MSRKLFSYPCKNKHQNTINEKYELFLKEVGHKVNNITTDLGSEFISLSWKDIDKKNNINHHFVDVSDHTAMSKCERVNQFAIK